MRFARIEDKMQALAIKRMSPIIWLGTPEDEDEFYRESARNIEEDARNKVRRERYEASIKGGILMRRRQAIRVREEVAAMQERLKRYMSEDSTSRMFNKVFNEGVF